MGLFGSQIESDFFDITKEALTLENQAGWIYVLGGLDFIGPFFIIVPIFHLRNLIFRIFRNIRKVN